MEQLLLLLGIGTGPSSPEQVKKREYRQATYFLRDDPERGEETTPFVGEAILKLHPGRFDHVHLFGTTASMWETLYRHTRPDDLSEEEMRRFYALNDAVKAGSLRQDQKPLRWVEECFQEHAGVPTACHVLPPGRSEDEFWTMLQTMADLDVRDGTVSLDITHGLRAQPLFLLLAIFYLRSIHPDVEMGSVFYGALELARDHFDGKTPIFDLRPMIELMDWIEAARVFERYEDAQPIANLLEQKAAEGTQQFDGLIRRAKHVSKIMQLNTLGQLQAKMDNFVSELEQQPKGVLPLDLIRPQLGHFAGQIAQTPDMWRALLKVSRQHWNHYRAGLAVLAAWEAVVARMAEIYQKPNYTEEPELHRALGYVACRWSDGPEEHVYAPADLGRMPRHHNKLRIFRNGIAHAERGAQENWSFEVEQVYQKFPQILGFLEQHLGSSALSKLPQHAQLDYNN